MQRCISLDSGFLSLSYILAFFYQLITTRHICYTTLSYCNLKLREYIWAVNITIFSIGLINLYEEMDDVGATGSISLA